MKLIIDIADDEYKRMKDESIYSTHAMICAIQNGTPLNDVIAELEKHQYSREYCCAHNIDTSIDMGMVRIILNNIGKADIRGE